MTFSPNPQPARTRDARSSQERLPQRRAASASQYPAPKAPEIAPQFDGLTVFSATTSFRRDTLGDDITEWLRRHPELTPVNTVIRLSSDARFHCLSILIFWRGSPSSK
jgi:hypothetical protein